MLTTPKMNVVQELIAGASREELIWLSGSLAGVAAQSNAAAQPATQAAATPAAPAAAALPKITIAYGTETGNSKKLATDFAAKAKKKGISAKLVGLEQYRLGDLSKEEYFLTVISTQGDGEPPASAKKFYDHLYSNGVKLPQLKYSVLALGDTSYPLFCKAGEDVDLQLGSLGGSRIVGIQRCDVDFESDAQHWMNEVIQKISGNHTASDIASKPVKKSTGKKIYEGEILTNI